MPSKTPVPYKSQGQQCGYSITYVFEVDKREEEDTGSDTGPRVEIVQAKLRVTFKQPARSLAKCNELVTDGEKT